MRRSRYALSQLGIGWNVRNSLQLAHTFFRHDEICATRLGPPQVILASIVGLPRACKNISQCAQAVLSRHQEDSNTRYRLLVFVENLTRNLTKCPKLKIN